MENTIGVNINVRENQQFFLDQFKPNELNSQKKNSSAHNCGGFNCF